MPETTSIGGGRPEADAAGAETHPADRLLAAIERRAAPVCVGLDPVMERLPTPLRRPGPDAAAATALGDFSRRVLDAVAPHVPCVKIQAACFERYRGPGMSVLFDLVADAHARGLEVILDAKRGDIGLSARHYAAAAFEGGPGASADWITINAYLGADGMQPFLDAGGGAFALVRTSNPGGDALQETALAEGGTVADRVAAVVADLGRRVVGRRGYSALGAVVGATRPQAAARLRAAMPEQILLVPGFGAQGGGVDDVRPCFRDDGTGAIVAATRSVIYAFRGDGPGWADEVAEAAAGFADEVGRAVGLR